VASATYTGRGSDAKATSEENNGGGGIGSILSMGKSKVKVEQKVKMSGPFADMLQERLRRRNEL
jgi:hypothetical protein